MGESGFEPLKALPADLQSVPFGHSGTLPYKADNRTRTDNLLITNQLLCQLSHIGEDQIWLKKWGLQGSNLWPSACKADALPAELRPHIFSLKCAIDISATRMGFEPTTSAVTGRRSNQLSHRANLQGINTYTLKTTYWTHPNLLQQLLHPPTKSG